MTVHGRSRPQARGRNRFSSNLEPWSARKALPWPGRWGFYSYYFPLHMDCGHPGPDDCHGDMFIRLIYEVDPPKCPRCGGEMRVIALTQEPLMIDKILVHLRDKGRDARAGPWATGPPGTEASVEAA